MRDEEKQILSKGSKLQQVLRKKWVFPAIYLASAALILTAVLWYQNSGDNASMIPDDTEQEQSQVSYSDEEAVPVNLTEESLQMPVENEDLVVIQKGFYEYDATAEEQQAALVFYNNTYHQNTGIDLVAESGESFEVLASASGTVIKAEKDALLGNVVEIEHENGVVTMYQSLEDVKVEKGGEVQQGQPLGVAGRNVFNKDAGVHVHFEIRANETPVNPKEYLGQPLSKIVESLDNMEEAPVTEETDASNNEEENDQPIDEQEDSEAPVDEDNQDA